MAHKLKQKFIGDDQVGSVQLLIEKNAGVRGTLQDNSEVNLVKLNTSDEVLLKGIKILDSSGLVPAAVLPSYVDDVIEVADFAALPVTGESGKIYVTLDTGKCYRWSGSTYIQITSGSVDSVNGQTGIVVLDASDIGATDGVTNTDIQALLDDMLKLDGTRAMTGDLDLGGNDISNVLTLSASGNIGSNDGTSTVSIDPTGGFAHAALDSSANVSFQYQAGIAINKTESAVAYGAMIFEAAPLAADLGVGLLIQSYADLDAADIVVSGKDLRMGHKSTGAFKFEVFAPGPYTQVAYGQVAKESADMKISAVGDLKLQGAAQIKMLSEVDMGSTHKLVNLANGTANGDAVNFGQLSGIETSLQGLIDALEAVSVQFVQEQFTLSSGDISNGYIDLANLAYVASINAFVDRLSIHGGGDDYSVSTVGGVSRITFLNSLITPGQEKLAAGDVITVKYAKLAIA